MQKTYNSRIGLTLIELVVVLSILVALGGIAAATLPNMLTRTHVATVATSLPTIDAAIRQNILLNSGQMGDGFDSLMIGSTPLITTENNAYAAYTLTAANVSGLSDLGVTQLVPAVAADNITFGSHAGVPVDISDSTSVLTLTGTPRTNILANVWNYEAVPGAEYAVFGLGERSSLVGAGEDAFFSEAPLHAVDAHSERADNAYARVMIVVELNGDEARYIGVGAPHPDGIQGVATHLQEWYGG